MDIKEILQHLPHRYPFLLLDRVLEIEPGKRILALKNVTYNEPFFAGHFPHLPVMPGVLIIEAMAQAAAVLAFRTAERKQDDKTVVYFAGIDHARFKRPVVPGDQLLLRAELTRSVRGIWKFATQAKVGDALAAEADLMCAVRDIE
jgi:3-hydroxyacyl-[acyl-carrier-protein] dehydratase